MVLGGLHTLEPSGARSLSSYTSKIMLYQREMFRHAAAALLLAMEELARCERPRRGHVFFCLTPLNKRLECAVRA